jgi:methionine aminopeptidase
VIILQNQSDTRYEFHKDLNILCLNEDMDSIFFDFSQKYKNEKDIKKGIAFPTCLSMNNCICHFSPSKNDADYVLKEDDLVKIDVGVHIDGFIAVVAHTIVVGATADKKVTGRKADVILAAYQASQAALRLLSPGNGVSVITQIA